MDVDALSKVCASLAGAFSEENVNCVVCIDIKDRESKYVIVQSSFIEGSTPQQILQQLSQLFDVDQKDIITTVFQLCGGLNGSKIN